MLFSCVGGIVMKLKYCKLTFPRRTGCVGSELDNERSRETRRLSLHEDIPKSVRNVLHDKFPLDISSKFEEKGKKAIMISRRTYVNGQSLAQEDPSIRNV